MPYTFIRACHNKWPQASSCIMLYKCTQTNKYFLSSHCQSKIIDSSKSYMLNYSGPVITTLPTESDIGNKIEVFPADFAMNEKKWGNTVWLLDGSKSLV